MTMSYDESTKQMHFLNAQNQLWLYKSTTLTIELLANYYNIILPGTGYHIIHIPVTSIKKDYLLSIA